MSFTDSRTTEEAGSACVSRRASHAGAVLPMLSEGSGSARGWWVSSAWSSCGKAELEEPSAVASDEVAVALPR